MRENVGDARVLLNVKKRSLLQPFSVFGITSPRIEPTNSRTRSYWTDNSIRYDFVAGGGYNIIQKYFFTILKFLI